MKQFLRHHQLALLCRISRDTPGVERRENSFAYVVQVFTDLPRLPARDRALPLSDLERTFWHTLYVLEALAELQSQDRCDRDLSFLLASLRGVKHTPRCKAPLPKRYFSSRPGENEPEVAEPWPMSSRWHGLPG